MIIFCRHCWSGVRVVYDKIETHHKLDGTLCPAQWKIYKRNGKTKLQKLSHLNK